MGAIPDAMSQKLSDESNGNFQPETGLVLFSGGQDSATCLAWALERFAQVETLGFDTASATPLSLNVVPNCSPA